MLVRVKGSLSEKYFKSAALSFINTINIFELSRHFEIAINFSIIQKSSDLAERHASYISRSKI